MIQNLIAYLIIGIAFCALMVNILRFFKIIDKKSTNSSKCAGCSTSCGMKKLHPLKRKNVVNQDRYRFYL